MLSKTAVASLATLAAASPEFQLRPWKAPGPGDSRGPCPMANTLANHGYLPHNGRNLTMEQFGKAVVEALNAQPSFGTTPAKAFIRETGKESFDLEELNKPGVLQHISSLTRDDVEDPTSTSALVSRQRVKDLIGDSSTDYVTISSISRSRLRVEALSSPAEMTRYETALSYMEAALIIMMMNEDPVPSGWTFPGPEAFKAHKERVSTWLTEERLPDELGWTRSERTITTVDLAAAMYAIFNEKRAVLGKPPLWKAWIPSYFTRGGRDEL